MTKADHPLQWAIEKADSWYFAYGSNLDPDRKTLRTGAIRDARRARLRGHRLAFNKRGDDGSAKANIVIDQHSEVWGVAYLCSQEALGQMDRSEGVPTHYRRHAVEVILDNDELIDAVTYIANPNQIDDSLKPNPDYLGYILRGMLHHRLPESYRATVQDLGPKSL